MTRRARRGLIAATATLCLALLAGGCVQMPDSGAVHETDTSADTSEEQASSIDAVPPQPNAPARDVAKGFIDAMSAWPIQTGVARQFLSEEAAESWRPGLGTITYTGSLILQDRSNEASVQLSEPERLDASGAWQGQLPEAQRVLDLQMTFEDGEYRITNPPNALVVPASWFAQRFRQVSLYFFDRTGRILVPEPVFVPRGDQLPSTLVERLADGPSGELSRISRSYLPDVEPVLSVPVTGEGVAQVEFGESVSPPGADDDLERMLAQLGWTLKQVPGISALRVSIGGQEVRLPGGGAEYDVNQAQEYDPAAADADPLLYGLRGGRLVYGEPDTLAAADGPFGEDDHGLRSVSLRLDAGWAAGVSSDGDSLKLAQVRGAGRAEVHTIARGSTDLLPPAWDFTNRLWVVDRTAAGARVAFREPRGSLTVLDVPGVTGRQVTAFLVSRDATRFVAVVRGRRGDQLRAGRILVGDNGRVDVAGPTRRIQIAEVDRTRITDIAWNSPTSILVLRPLSDELSEINTVAVDGAPVAEALSPSVSGRLVALAAAPDDRSTPFAVTPEALVDLESLATIPLSDGRVTSIGYVG